MPIMDRSLVWVELLGAHFECSTGQLDQVRQLAHEKTLAGVRGSADDHPTGVMSDPADPATVAYPNRALEVCTQARQ
jgi:hypothetical protein